MTIPNDPLTDGCSVHRELRDGGEDGLTPLESLDLSAIHDCDSLLEAMALTAFGGRRLGEAAEVLTQMVCDPKCAVVLTLSGAMTVAKMGLVITEMIERGFVQAVVSTGALMTHGLVELAGMQHYKAEPHRDDAELFAAGYNRVYDTYEMEKNLDEVQRLLDGVFARCAAERERFASRHLCSAVGEILDRPGCRGILVSAYRAGVPIYIPAFTDSEMGLDLGTWIVAHARAKQPDASIDELLRSLHSPFDPFLDLGHYSAGLSGCERLGIVTIGGGVPRNWAQQAPPFVDVLNAVLKIDMPLRRFRYGVRICPEPAHFGGLSGCTYSEGVSWGKFVPQAEGGRFAEVHADATIAWPVLIKAVIERLERTGLSASGPRWT